MAGRARIVALALLGVVVLISVFIQFQFELMRYYFEYYYEIVRWHALPMCELTSTRIQEAAEPNTSWDALLSDQLAYARDRWVLTSPPVDLGLCNRILHSLSTLVFAMATNRTLWIEWEEQPPQYITANEYAGMSSYESLFVSEFHNPKFRPPQALIDSAIPDNRTCFTERLRYSADLNQDYSARVLRLESGEWWAPLLLKNRAHAMFRGLSPVDGFPLLFRAMFTLRPPEVQPEECSWMIQYRTIWPPPRHTAPIETFLSCAHSKGLTPADYSTTWIVADDPSALLTHATPAAAQILAAMHLPGPSCRGPCGDRQAMETMYRLSRCRNAVLTLGSSFGSCISSLAGAGRQFRVSEFGECIPFMDGPIDANTFSRNGNLGTYLIQRTD